MREKRQGLRRAVTRVLGRVLGRVLTRALGPGALAAALLAGPAAAQRSPAQVACDGNRLLGLLERTTLDAPGSARAGLTLTLAPSGAFQGVVHAAGADGRESLLAFSVSFEESTLLRNPERPQLSSVIVSRNDLVTDRTGDSIGERPALPLSLSIDPTLSTDPSERDPATQIVLDNRTVAAGQAISRPGRGLDHLVAPCHGALADAEVQVLRVLSRMVRITPTGASRVAFVTVYPDTAADRFRIDAYLAEPAGSSGAPGALSADAPRLSARVHVTRDRAGRLLGGSMRVLPACAAGDDGPICSSAPVGTEIALRPPVFLDAPSSAGPSAAVLAGGTGGGDEVALDWTGLLAESTWRAPLERPTPSLALELAAGPVVTFTAHPDDEVLMAPLLGEVCAELDARCTLVVATRGERGVCLLPGGCAPDVATVRAGEMERAAELFRAHLVPWDLGDGTARSAAGVRAAWAAAAGGEQALLDRVADAVLAAQASVPGMGDGTDPGVLLTFDPRHGSTGHADHRALGQLVLDAVERLPADRRPAIYLLETRATLGDDDTVELRPDAAAAPLVAFDATRFMVRLGAPAWQYLLDDALIHRSQFSRRLVDHLAAIEPAKRRVWLERRSER